ncbi:substrate-binding periplasmic protein [Pseudonocardia sp. GCM10023141]|uniref:substrate-binding periplasmic protein n=1 Tax=Pseudonocardia sp. GCM10023141 TaxID=3252653 RepID=UPI003612D220
MRRTLRSLAVAVATTAALATAGCGSGAATDTAANPYGLITPGTLLAATSGDQPPFSLLENGEPSGFTIALNDEVAKRLGLHTEYKQTDTAAAIQGLTARQYDMVASGLGITPEREKSILFAKGEYWSTTAALTLKAHPVAAMDGLAGKKVAVITGSVQVAYLKKINGAVATEFPSQNAAVSALHSGNVDALLVGGPDAEAYLKQFDDLAISAAQPVDHATTVAFQKGATALGAAYDAQLEAMVADGTYRRIYDRWFTQAPLPELLKIWPGLA